MSVVVVNGDSASEIGLIVHEGLVGVPSPETAAVVSTDLDGVLRVPLMIHENATDGCGGRIWPAGRVLAKYMLARYANGLEGKTMCVLYFGSASFHSDLIQALTG